MSNEGPTGTISIDSLTGGTASGPVITLSEILSDVNVLQQQETNDRLQFRAISNPSIEVIRSKLISWAAAGFQGQCDLLQINISAPNVCSDGVVRNFFDYIQFVSGKTVQEHVLKVQSILPDFQVAYRCSRSELVICAIKA